MRFVIFSGGDLTPSKHTKNIIQEANVIIAADSGADTALKFGITPSVVIGDMDSISSKAKRMLSRQIILGKSPTTLLSIPKGHNGPLSDSEKDQTDTQLAIEYAINHKASRITILGGSAGTRFDHILANLFLTSLYTIPIYFINHNQTSWIVKGPKKEIIEGKKGDTLSLIPIQSDVKKINSTGLYYPLKEDTLVFGKPRGVSNIMILPKATVWFPIGTLLFVHTAN